MNDVDAILLSVVADFKREVGIEVIVDKVEQHDDKQLPGGTVSVLKVLGKGGLGIAVKSLLFCRVDEAGFDLQQLTDELLAVVAR